MTRIFVLWFIFISLATHAQMVVRQDTILFTDGTIMAGKVIKIEREQYIEVMTADSFTHLIEDSTIRKIKFSDPNYKAQSYWWADRSRFWSNPALPHELVRRHNIGLGLTITGSILTVLGPILTVSPSYNKAITLNSLGKAIVITSTGIALDFIGPGVTIGGIVELVRSKRKAKRALADQGK